MGWQFRKSLRLMPGVRLNLTHRGLSATLGGSPFSVNLGRRGVRRTLSLPGTGLSHRSSVAGGGGRSQTGGCAVLILAGIATTALLGQCSRRSEPASVTAAPAQVATVPEARSIGPVLVAQRNANCRAGPSLTAPVWQTIRRGDSVVLMAAGERFHHVRMASGVRCHVAVGLLSTPPAPGATSGGGGG